MLLGATALLPLQGALAAGPHDHHGHQAPQQGKGAGQEPAPRSVKLQLPDALLMDQDGRAVRLLGDVVQDKVVVASFVYTHCTTICPTVSALFSGLQERLGNLQGSRVHLVSLSVDPARDTPERLKAYSEGFGTRAGWLWLTGQPAEVTAALKGFDAYTAKFEEHPAVIMIGDSRSGRWIRYHGFTDADRLAAQVRAVLTSGIPASAAAGRS